ncbi:TIGR03086 family metal-binding protein [Nocardia otitidiscaviarum]
MYMLTFDALTTPTDLVALNARAVRASSAAVSHCGPADLSKPTPCADWTLRDLLIHMIAQHRGFAAAARGDDNPNHWRPHPLGPDPVADYRAAADDVLDAFAADDILERAFPLPEFTTEFRFPGTQALTFHFIDYVVHTWDVDRTLGRTTTFDDDLLAAALPIAEFVPDDASRTAPGAAFAPRRPWTGEATLDRIVALLGRSPRWPA